MINHPNIVQDDWSRCERPTLFVLLIKIGLVFFLSLIITRSTFIRSNIKTVRSMQRESRKKQKKKKKKNVSFLWKKKRRWHHLVDMAIDFMPSE